MKRLPVSFFAVSFLFVLLTVLSGCSRKSPRVISQPLESAWQFKQATDSVWYPAVVPGTVHTDLLRNKLIPDPYYGTNESKLQWIGRKSWIYRTRFSVPDSIYRKNHILLVFKGLDTYATVRLNGKLVLKADNMFRTWKVDCKKYLRKKGNVLTILFRSPMAVNKLRFEHQHPYLPADNDHSPVKVSVFTRKAPYQFGWDWGPRFLTCGIWRPVEIIAWNRTRIFDYQVYQKKVTDTLARLKAVVGVNSDDNAGATLRLFANDTLLVEKNFRLKKGKNHLTIPFQIKNPRLWWTNGLGKPNMYRFSVVLSEKGEKTDEKTVRFGIRTLEIVQKPDSAGSSFYVKLNGIPVFMKGANYIPQDDFLPDVSKQRYQSMIHAAKRLHMNMLRVWGGGIYENNVFYDLCDENGILVWQEFMFACSFYPGDTAFLNNVKQEAIDNVKRLRNHPCLALWCGNNEVRVAWDRWGYQKKYHYTKADSAKVFGDYVKLFRQLLPSVVHRYDSGRFYWPSSPHSAPKGWKQETLSGDMHYWGVWGGRKPFSAYNQYVGRFMSEFGFQSLPDYSTIAAFAPDTSRYLISPVMRAHNKNPAGYDIIHEYMQRNFKVPQNFKDYVIVSQLLQAKGMKTAIEAYRRNRPWCMGSLFWQLDDCWPVVSWSAIDYYGRWKALAYNLQQLYAPVLVSPVMQHRDLKIYLVSDLLKKKPVTIKMSLEDFYGRKYWQKTRKTEMQPNSSRIVFSAPFAEKINRYGRDRVFLHVSVFSGDSLLARNNLFFSYPKDLHVPPPIVHSKMRNENGKFSLVLSSGTFVKYVVLEYPDDKGVFSDNYFSLLPGQQKIVHVYLKNAAEAFRKKQIKIKAFY